MYTYNIHTPISYPVLTTHPHSLTTTFELHQFTVSLSLYSFTFSPSCPIPNLSPKKWAWWFWKSIRNETHLCLYNLCIGHLSITSTSFREVLALKQDKTVLPIYVEGINNIKPYTKLKYSYWNLKIKYCLLMLHKQSKSRRPLY